MECLQTSQQYTKPQGTWVPRLSKRLTLTFFVTSKSSEILGEVRLEKVKRKQKQKKRFTWYHMYQVPAEGGGGNKTIWPGHVTSTITLCFTMFFFLYITYRDSLTLCMWYWPIQGGKRIKVNNNKTLCFKWQEDTIFSYSAFGYTKWHSKERILDFSKSFIVPMIYLLSKLTWVISKISLFHNSRL